jgi:hypothetical protein
MPKARRYRFGVDEVSDKRGPGHLTALLKAMHAASCPS